MALFKPVKIAGKTRYEVESDPSAMVFNTRAEAETQRSLLDTFKPRNDGRRSS